MQAKWGMLKLSTVGNVMALISLHKKSLINAPIHKAQLVAWFIPLVLMRSTQNVSYFKSLCTNVSLTTLAILKREDPCNKLG